MDKNTVDGRVVVEATELVEQFGFADGLWKVNQFAFNVCLLKESAG